jgi:hypothetical protein
MLVKGDQFAAAMNPETVGMMCPKCGHNGSFEDIPAQNSRIADVLVLLENGDQAYAGLRRCPNPHCYAVVYVVRDFESKVVISYPARRIDFDSSDIPLSVRDAFEEALECHASSCFKASAMMIRKTLEELCDERGATGNTLAERLEALQDKVVLPAGLMLGLDEIRLFGNDATHVEARIYREIDADAVEIAILFTREVLKSVYQSSALVEKMKAFRIKERAAEESEPDSELPPA